MREEEGRRRKMTLEEEVALKILLALIAGPRPLTKKGDLIADPDVWVEFAFRFAAAFVAKIRPRERPPATSIPGPGTPR